MLNTTGLEALDSPDIIRTVQIKTCFSGFEPRNILTAKRPHCSNIVLEYQSIRVI